MHEGYVRHHWLDYDETWRNDAFPQDISLIALTTQGAMLGDPEEKSISGEQQVYLFFSLSI